MTIKFSDVKKGDVFTFSFYCNNGKFEWVFLKTSKTDFVAIKYPPGCGPLLRSCTYDEVDTSECVLIDFCEKTD